MNAILSPRVPPPAESKASTLDLSTREGRREQGLLIQGAVEKAGLSVEELANRIGCSRALIYQYLSGTTLAQPDRLQQIAAVTDVPLAHFYGAGPPQEGRRGRRTAEPGDTQARLAERIHQLEDLAQAQEGPPDWDGLASTCERIISLAAQAEDSQTEARALLRLGKARVRMGEFNRSIDSLNRAAGLFTSLGDVRGEADARQALGNAMLATGRMPEAQEQFAWVAHSDLWSARWSGAVSLAAVAEQLGDYRAAMERCDEASAILEEGTSPEAAAEGMLYVNANRVNIYLACGDFKSGASLAERCLVDAEANGNSDQHLEARLNLGMCALHQGRWAQSHRMLSAAIPLARFVHDRGREAMSRAIFALLLAAIGDYDAAMAQAKDALGSALAHADHRAELFAQMALTDAYSRTGRDTEARYHANQAFAVASALRLQLYQAETRLRIARLCLKTGDPAEAQEHIERAISISEQLGARHVEAEAKVLRAEMRQRGGSNEEALDDVRAGLALAVELGISPIEWQAQAVLARVAAAVEPPRAEEAENAAERAVALIEAVRADLREAGIADTILEDRDRQEAYLLRARLLVTAGRPAEANTFIQQAGWPPLAARFADQPA